MKKTDYKQATWVGTPNYTQGRQNPAEYITLHIMAGYLAGTDATFSKTASRASSTYGVGADGSVHQYVAEADTAWADGNGTSGNSKSISIEHEGGITGATVTEAEIIASAKLCADIARRHGWTKLVHGENVKLHREIPPYTHPNCPDKCPNPLPWARIIEEANTILAGTETEDDMHCIIQINGEDALTYYDGVKLHKLTHPDQAKAIQMVAKETLGHEIPVFVLGSQKYPWGTRFEQAVNA